MATINPPAGGGGPPVLPMPAPAMHSYINYCNDASNNPYSTLANGYADVLDPFDIDIANANNNLTPNEVQNLVLAGTGAVPLLLLHDGKVNVYLQVSRFDRRLGLPRTPWDDQMFATKGDLHRNQAVTANWLPEYFHQIAAQVNAPSIVTIQNSFAGDPNLEAMGPYANGDAGTEVIRVRRSVYCPAPYAALLLAAPVTPRIAFELITAQLTIDGKLAECNPLVKWLQVALLAVANNGASPLQLGVAPTAPLADHNLLGHREKILHLDFPLLNQANAQLQQHQIATQIGNLVADTRLHRADELRRKALDKVKSPIDLVGATGVASLCRYVRAPTEAGLPPIYQRIASATRHNRLTELQWAVDAERTRLGYNRLKFTVTPAILNRVVSVSWVMDHPDSLTTGLQPYLFGDSTPEESQHMSSLYQLVTAGSAAPSLSDAATLVTPNKPCLPKHLFQSREMLQRVQILFHVLLGDNHPMTINLTQFLCDFIDRESTLFYYRPTTPGYELCMPILLIQWITLRIDNWFRNQAVIDMPVSVPNFGELFTDIELARHWEPRLSSQVLSEYLPPALPRPVPALPRPAPPRPALALPPSSSGGGATTGGSPAGGGTPAPSNPIPNTVVRNTNFKAMFDTFRQMNVNHSSLRNRITVRPPPSPHSTTGGEMCLSYHIKAMCNLRCSRADDHNTHTDSQDQKLVEWCTAHYTDS